MVGIVGIRQIAAAARLAADAGRRVGDAPGIMTWDATETETETETETAIATAIAIAETERSFGISAAMGVGR